MPWRESCAKYMYDSIGRLVTTLLHFLQRFLLRLVQGTFQPYSGGVREVAAFHTVALYHVLRIVFLADGDGPFLTIAGDVHAEDLRKFLHDGSTIVNTVCINFEHPPGAKNLVSRRD